MNIFIAISIFYDELGQRAVIKLATAMWLHLKLYAVQSKGEVNM